MIYLKKDFMRFEALWKESIKASSLVIWKYAPASFLSNSIKFATLTIIRDYMKFPQNIMKTVQQRPRILVG